MEILYKTFEVAIGLFFVFMVIRFLKCRFGKCDIK